MIQEDADNVDDDDDDDDDVDTDMQLAGETSHRPISSSRPHHRNVATNKDEDDSILLA